MNLTLIKYRKFLKTKNKNLIFFKKYFLICDFNNFNGLGLKLLKLFCIKNNFKFKLHKFFIYNSKFIKHNLIFFKFNKFKNLLSFINFSLKLTLIPFCYYPLFILNKNKNILLPLKKKFNNNFCIKVNKIFLLKKILLTFIQKLLLNFFFKLIIKLQCQL